MTGIMIKCMHTIGIRNKDIPIKHPRHLFTNME